MVGPSWSLCNCLQGVPKFSFCWVILGAELLFSQGNNAPIQVTTIFFNLDKLGQNSAPLCQGGGQPERVHACFTGTTFQYFPGLRQVFQQAAVLGEQQQGNGQ